MAGKCPKCEQSISSVTLEHIDIAQGFNPTWHGVSYSCPSCRTILGVGIDPVALKTDTVKDVLHGLGKSQ